MSVSVMWRPATDTGKPVGSGTSSSLDKLKSVFSAVVSPTDIPTLRAMTAASGDSFYNDIANIVENVGTINVWGEY